MEWRFILEVSTLALLACGVVIYYGRKLSKNVQTHAPNSELTLRVTLTGTSLMACTIAFWVFCLVIRELKSESPFGAFLNGADNLIAVFVVSIFFVAIAAVILEKLGYPAAKRVAQNGRGDT